MNRRNHDEARERILSGEEVQITVRSCDWYQDGQIGTRTVSDLRFRTDSGRWASRSELQMVTNPENGHDDAASILASLTRWLEAGRKAEAVAE